MSEEVTAVGFHALNQRIEMILSLKDLRISFRGIPLKADGSPPDFMAYEDDCIMSVYVRSRGRTDSVPLVQDKRDAAVLFYVDRYASLVGLYAKMQWDRQADYRIIGEMAILPEGIGWRFALDSAVICPARPENKVN